MFHTVKYLNSLNDKKFKTKKFKTVAGALRFISTVNYATLISPTGEYEFDYVNGERV